MLKSKPFELVSPFKPAGDQPKAIESLVKGLNRGEKDQVLLGVTGSGKSLTSHMPVWIYEENEYSEYIPRLVSIGAYINDLFSKYGSASVIHNDTEELSLEHIDKKVFVPSINPTTKCIDLKPVYSVTRHAAPDKLYRLETQCGRMVEVTGDHNFFVQRKGRWSLLETSEIEKGDFIPLPMFFDAFTPSKGKTTFILTEYAQSVEWYLEIPIKISAQIGSAIKSKFGSGKLYRLRQEAERLTKTQAIPLLSKYPELKADARVNSLHGMYSYPFEYSISDDFLTFLGLYIAEGHASKNFALISVREKFLQDKMYEICRDLKFPINIRKDGDVQINNALWADILRNLCGERSGEKHLPSFWPELDKKQLAILLSAYYSGDGCVESNTISCTTKSQKLASDICYALARFDIWARILSKTKRKYFEVTITGQENIQRFYHFVGFLLPRKQDAAWKLFKKNENTNVDIIPLNQLFKEIRADAGISQQAIAQKAGVERSYLSMIENGKRYPSRTVARQLVYALKDFEKASSHKRFPELVAMQNCRWTPVKKLEIFEHDHEYVYDFSVKDNETFLAGYGGMFVHNTFSVASVIAETQKPTLILSHNKTLAAQLYSEFQEFFPNNAVSYFVSYYDYYQPEAYLPATDTYIEKDASINEEINKFRHQATMSLLTRRDVIIIATVSCIYGLGSVKSYEALAIPIKKGETFQRDRLLRRLTDIQYSRSQMDFKQGMFHVLGDVVEIFPPSKDTIYRLEFFGDEIETIVEADSFTGEVIAEFDEITIFPAKHDVVQEEQIKGAVDLIKSDMELRYKELQKQGKMLEAERIKTRTEYDLEILQETGYCSGVENYTRYLNSRAAGARSETLLDYFPDDFLMVVDESHITIPQIGGMFNGNFSRKQTLVDHGFRLPSAHDNRPLKFEEFEDYMHQAIYITATPGRYEMERTDKKNVIEQIVRPTGLIDPRIEIRPTKGQIPNIIEEIKKRIKVKERTLVTTLTKRSAEELTDYLVDAGLKVKYLHSDIQTFDRIEILRDLRLGKFDVLVGINLLREGLDLPEVSFIAILDADKQGFLRSTNALIQTIGRCARNVNGFVAMYADKITDGMKGALDETDRRRVIQEAYNREHGITPQTIVKAIRDLQSSNKKKGKDFDADGKKKKMNAEQLKRYIHELDNKMQLAVMNMEFEKAAEYRDEIEALTFVEQDFTRQEMSD